MKSASAIICLVFVAVSAYAADIPAERLERSQELLDNDKLLMEKLNTEEKVFVKNIVFKGDNSVSPETILRITGPYQGRWLTNSDMVQIVELIAAECRKSGRNIDISDFVCQVDNGLLEILISAAK
jgi:outer membrane protein assembly factor BamA